LVDDESVVIDVGKEMLEKLGYNVLVATSGKDAVEIFSKESERINLIILDMIMLSLVVIN
jgi:CheY-like chemotaxis protein